MKWNEHVFSISHSLVERLDGITVSNFFFLHLPFVLRYMSCIESYIGLLQDNRVVVGRLIDSLSIPRSLHCSFGLIIAWKTWYFVDFSSLPCGVMCS